ncbi:hypothetical protein EZV62_009482 [Acer yangbiense]|uniref:PGG domain-containing protein n=1 Tax=Acer yangbiense TaxID=1000413 RepID=A0A5C7I0P4_9ROSI|nr:hypothetical protein EZV62_009482 [Acer yangbiense]
MTNINDNHFDDHSNIISRIGKCIKQWFIQDFDQNSGELVAAFKNNMLVVATLIVAVTFQTGINPPGGAWQDTKVEPGGHEAGKAILAYLHLPYNLFLILNTLAFSMSTQIILMLVYNKKLYFEVVVATVSMVATYDYVFMTALSHTSGVFSWCCLGLCLVVPLSLILRDMASYPFDKQVKIVIATMAIHNYIRRHAKCYHHFEKIENDPNFILEEDNDRDDDFQEENHNANTPVAREVKKLRDSIAASLMRA